MTYQIQNINEISEAEYAAAFAMMAPDKQARVDRFRFEADKKRTVCGEWLARRMLAEICGTALENITFCVDKNGKPYAEELPVYFNISHSGEKVLCAVSEQPVGADIEQMHPIRDKLIRYVCTDREQQYVLENGIAEQEKIKRFFSIWTCKEAYFKWLGTGITDLKSISIDDVALQSKSVAFVEDGYAVAIVTGDL